MAVPISTRPSCSHLKMVPGAFSAPRDGDRLRFQKASDPSRRHGRVSLSAEAVRPDRAAASDGTVDRHIFSE